MPRYEITAPDGKRFEVTAPEGATQEQVLAYAKENFGTASQGKTPSIGERLGRGVGLAARGAGPTAAGALIGGAAGSIIPGIGTAIGAGAGATAMNLATLIGNLTGMDSSQVLDRIMDRLGLPKPETPVEEMAVSAAGAGAGQAGFAKAGELASRAVSPMAQRAGEILTTAPGMQVLGAGTGAAASEAARQRGVGPMGEFAASMAGASVPAASVAMARAPVTGVNLLKALIDPMTDRGQQLIASRTVQAQLEPSPQAHLAELQGAREIVPGSKPTAGEATQSGGLAALQRQTAQAVPEPYQQRTDEQMQARLRALRNIAGDPGQREFFETTRETTAEELYKRAFRGGIRETDITPPVKGEVTRLLKRPSIRAAVPEARRLALEEGLRLTDPLGSVQGMHYVKKALDDKLRTLPVGSNEARLIKGTQERLLMLMDKLSPDYAAARKTYAEMSKPISQMLVGERLIQQLRPAITEFGNVPRETPQSYAKAIRDFDKTVQSATGYKAATAEGTMTPQQIADARSVAEDVARKVSMQQRGLGVGSNTFQNLAMENVMRQAGLKGLPQLLSRPVQIANYLGRSLYAGANKDIQNIIAETLLDPKATAQLATKFKPYRSSQALAHALRGMRPLPITLPVLTQGQQP